MTEQRSTTRWGRVPAWWLLHPDVDADRFCVLAALATYADEHGVCVPSQATLAQRLHRSRPWVNRVVAQLAAEGFMKKVQRSRGNGGTTSCLYRLCLTPPDGPAPDTTPPDTTPPYSTALDAGETGTHAPPPPKPAQPAPAPAPTADPDVTGPVPHADTPCQPCDTNHLHFEHNNTPAPCAAATGACSGANGVNAEVPADWEPGAAEIADARRLCPSADLAAHTARFRARCRARGYRYRAGHLGDAWLAWLLEDHGTLSHRGRRDAPPGPHPAAGGPARVSPSPTLRFAAWAAAATAPPAPVRPASPWS